MSPLTPMASLGGSPRRIESAPNPPPPDTPVNRTRVQREREQWLAANRNGIPYANSAYPLSPGTLPASPDVCERCGLKETATHNFFTCTSAPLGQKEIEFRRNVRARRERIASMPRTPGSPPIVRALFMVELDTGELEQVAELSDEQLAVVMDMAADERPEEGLGNGQEST